VIRLQKRKRRNKKYKGKRNGRHWCITYAGILYCVVNALNRNTKMEDIFNIYYIFLFVVLIIKEFFMEELWVTIGITIFILLLANGCTDRFKLW
jgi:hypothetical protein